MGHIFICEISNVDLRSFSKVCLSDLTETFFGPVLDQPLAVCQILVQSEQLNGTTFWVALIAFSLKIFGLVYFSSWAHSNCFILNKLYVRDLGQVQTFDLSKFVVGESLWP